MKEDGRNILGASGLHKPEKLGTIEEEEKIYDTNGNLYKSRKDDEHPLVT
jgi:hypothetical protein